MNQKQYLSQAKKKEIFQAYSLAKQATDTGSAESQVALYSHRISHLTEHLKRNKKDHATKLSLLRLVGKRRKLLQYISKRDLPRYKNLLAALNLRK